MKAISAECGKPTINLGRSVNLSQLDILLNYRT